LYLPFYVLCFYLLRLFHYKYTRQMEFNEVIIIAKGIGIISVANNSGVKTLHAIERKKNCW
ncbi:MAG TPA: hypothetical protein PKZ75_14545, partial [Bacteroidia bacterium]|nr:hypothetical protein [Bacteroidia bacterium]